MSYEVQTFTLCDGWVNTWRIEHHDGTVEYETFASNAEAQAALDEYLDDLWDEITAGQTHPVAFDTDRYRVAKVGAP